MNRRGFLETIAAIALAAKTALVAPIVRRIRRKGNLIYAPAGERIRAGDPVCIRDGKIYKYPAGR